MLRFVSRTIVRQAYSTNLTKMPALQPKKLKGRMFSVQAALPKYPVAPLEQTLKKYLKSLEPLLTEDEYRHTEKLCKEFENGVGKTLQAKLIERAEKHDNWLSDWWKSVAYLGFREPVVINSNPGVLFPKADFSGTQGQIEYASKLIAGLLDYKVMIDDQTLPVEHLGKNPLCMMQYFQVLAACRIPLEKHDDWACYPPDRPGAPKHITVIYNNNIFEVPVYGDDGNPLTISQVRNQLLEVVNQGSTPGEPIGLFTMEHRDNWSSVYKKMIQDKTNKASFDSVQRSIIVLCLDQSNDFGNDPRTVSGHQMLHGGGPSLHSGNRWFDKTIQFIVGADGYSGLNYEHTTAEGPPIIHVMDHCLNFLANGKEWSPASDVKPPTKLQFNLTNDVSKSLTLAKENSARMVNDLDLKVFVFDEFGKNFPKSQKVSPDSFIQNAIQLAYYRHHRKTCGSYESASIRMFQQGRTETIRSCSTESFEFTKAMMDSNTSKQKKAELLRRAINSHKQYTNDAISGKGIDRHLLGLKLTALENNMEMPELFKDKAYTFSGSWRISTSQVPAKSESVLFFGPVMPDGYGFCYNPQEKCILFGVSSFKSNNVTLPAAKMADLIKDSLNDMRDVMASSMKANL
ncbi:carnitine O-acetyltransferase-like isoform X2 [Ruditapes philippinarum]|uniref:carnitine O-acetyltransferase-like isoform X2 n=1 Tax=Ruditapes philippinarum TaxID=129788 RepID=UPI00295B9AAC|nr:carnitine O-acetyltransferase-like isoform X2 [Ruditapes philippinarum]